MPAREFDEAFLWRSTVCEIGFQDAFDPVRGVLGLHVAVKFAPERRVGSEAAADEDVISLDRIGILVVLYLAGQKADFRRRNAARRNDGSRSGGC